MKVNWTVIENTSFECGEGDTISVRGYGRVKFFRLKEKRKKKNGECHWKTKIIVFLMQENKKICRKSIKYKRREYIWRWQICH